MDISQMQQGNSSKIPVTLRRIDELPKSRKASMLSVVITVIMDKIDKMTKVQCRHVLKKETLMVEATEGNPDEGISLASVYSQSTDDKCHTKSLYLKPFFTEIVNILHSAVYDNEVFFQKAFIPSFISVAWRFQ
ncbi:MAG: hypothetical protein QXZ17_16215 [Nitrososphaerota archaeon]